MFCSHSDILVSNELTFTDHLDTPYLKIVGGQRYKQSCLMRSTMFYWRPFYNYRAIEIIGFMPHVQTTVSAQRSL